VLDHLFILAISDTSPTIWTVAVALTSGGIVWASKRSGNDDR
jgi:hypothetical protein